MSNFPNISQLLLSIGTEETSPYEKELYQNICDIYLKYIAHI